MPDGIVVSLLANEEEEVKTIIPLLKPTLRMKVKIYAIKSNLTISLIIPQGLLVGTWYLDGTTINVRSMVNPDRENARYAFQMSLSLRSRPLGR